MTNPRVSDIEVNHPGLAKIFEAFAGVGERPEALEVNSLVKTGLKREDVEQVIRELYKAKSVAEISPDMVGGCAFRVVAPASDEGFIQTLKSLSNATAKRPAPVSQAMSVEIG